MIIYNVTIKVEAAIVKEWLQWMQQVHIPEVIATGCFTHAVMVRLLDIDDTEGPTYAVQYHAESKANYNRYIDKFADELRQKGFSKWGNKFVAFRSLMQVVA
jgi:GMP synthase-like glutamine amidotransferase